MDFTALDAQEQKHALVHGRRRRRYQCRSCRYQTTVTAGTIMGTSMPSLTKWFQALYLGGDANTGISSRALKRKLGIDFRTAWLQHHKIRPAMSELEESYCPAGHRARST